MPVQLILSKKNMGYLAEAKQREVKLIPMPGTLVGVLPAHSAHWWLVRPGDMSAAG